MIAPIRDAFSTVTARKRQAPPRPLARDALDLGDDVIELLVGLALSVPLDRQLAVD